MIRIAVSGVAGRMGSIVSRVIADAPGLRLVAGIERPGHEAVGLSLVGAGGPVGVVIEADLEVLAPGGYDVLVDFSAPPQAAACAEKAARDGKALVVGTTGLGAAEIASVERAAATSPVVVAPNMSVGVAVLESLASQAARTLGGEFDIEIVEAHHRGKRDAPSGTATRLLDLTSRARGATSSGVVRAGRSGPDAARRPGEIGVHSLRGGAIVGRHSIHFIGDVEEIVLAHVAFTREAFGRGVVRAVRFVHGRAPGLYDMADVLGLGERRA